MRCRDSSHDETWIGPTPVRESVIDRRDGYSGTLDPNESSPQDVSSR